MIRLSSSETSSPFRGARGSRVAGRRWGGHAAVMAAVDSGAAAGRRLGGLGIGVCTGSSTLMFERDLERIEERVERRR